MTLDQIVSDYIDRFRRPGQDEMAHYQQATSLAEAIRCACSKGHDHQRRVRASALADAELRLQATADKLSCAADFQELFDIVTNETGVIYGVGRNGVTAYDITHRIGAFLGISPALVYLHNGTAQGARCLGFRGATIDPAKLPAPFSRLTPAEIEDCLCIYKRSLRGDDDTTTSGTGCLPQRGALSSLVGSCRMAALKAAAASHGSSCRDG